MQITRPHVKCKKKWMQKLVLQARLNQTLQYCAKVEQVNFREIPGFLNFSKKFSWKRYFEKFPYVLLQCVAMCCNMLSV